MGCGLMQAHSPDNCALKVIQAQPHPPEPELLWDRDSNLTPMCDMSIPGAGAYS